MHLPRFCCQSLSLIYTSDLRLRFCITFLQLIMLPWSPKTNQANTLHFNAFFSSQDGKKRTQYNRMCKWDLGGLKIATKTSQEFWIKRFIFRQECANVSNFCDRLFSFFFCEKSLIKMISIWLHVVWSNNISPTHAVYRRTRRPVDCGPNGRNIAASTNYCVDEMSVG